ncbi:MAG TPA: ABC transporter ATP-binding protein [Promineifilum sp.]|nr:ABC transporter ATP-binding protein [Promineifilum sp.]HRO24457.1 ABC transporter ATP-binding protein [Promineifilum sp.]HRQ12353.1 ABC transporter ATP-binding protein [Promineifilum sp.]
MLLSVNGLAVRYGAIQALHDISFEVEEGEIVTLIGANGAGKSTTLWTIIGQIGEMGGQVVSGSITYRGENLLGQSASQIVRKYGISLVPEGRRIFGNLTVLENLKLAAYTRKDKEAIARDLERVFAAFPRLDERKSQLADLLSGGEQQMLAVGRALMTNGRLILLDEPSMGLSPLLVQNLFKTLHEINQSGITLLLVEQNANLALKYASRAYVLETGNVVLEGSAAEISRNPLVKQAYLGG